MFIVVYESTVVGDLKCSAETVRLAQLNLLVLLGVVVVLVFWVQPKRRRIASGCVRKLVRKSLSNTGPFELWWLSCGLYSHFFPPNSDHSLILCAASGSSIM